MKEKKEEIDTRPKHMKIEIEFHKNEENGETFPEYRLNILIDNKNVELSRLTMSELDWLNILCFEFAYPLIHDEIEKHDKYSEKNKEIFLKKHGFYD